MLKITFEFQKTNKKKKSEVFNFSAIHLIYDPQGEEELADN